MQQYFNQNTRLAAIVICLIIMTLSGYRMYSLWQVQELWGHLPLFFFTSFWAVLQLLLAGRKKQHPKRSRWMAFSTTSGVLLALGFPPIPLTFLMFIGFVPLLVVEKELSDEQNAPSKKELFKYAYNTFVIWNILTTWWVANTAFVAGIVAIFLNAFFMCVPFLLFHQTKKVMPNMAYAAFIGYMLCFEMLHLHWEISWVWLNLGNAFAEFPSWIQWYEYTGTFGGSLWILLVNVLIVKWLYNGEKKSIRNAAPILALILLPLLFSAVLYINHEEKGEAINVVVGQPNFEPHYEKFTVKTTDLNDELLELAQAGVTAETDYYIYPETVFPQVNEDKPSKNSTAQKFQQLLVEYPNLKLITGASAYHIFEKGEAITAAARDQKSRDGSVVYQFEALNAAVQYQFGKTPQTYRKSKFVPGAELLPYRKIFFFLKPLVDKLQGSMAGYGSQEKRSILTSDKGNAAPVICYESVFGDYHSKYVQQGADFIVIMTNDGWWDNTAGHKQHLKFASLRAIETRRAIARSANTGVSAFINQRGDIVAQTQYDEQTNLTASIQRNQEITFYVVWGDLIGRLAIFLTAILLLNTIVKNWQKRIK